jgi:hypothetical protein
LYECDELGWRLSAFFEYEPAEVGSVEPMSGLKLEPDYPEVWTLISVFLPNSNVDLSGVLHPDVIFRIEQDAPVYFEEMRSCMTEQRELELCLRPYVAACGEMVKY